MVDEQQIFNEFGLGLAGSQPIKDFLQYTKTSWQRPAPQYVIFVGDGSYDLKNEMGYGNSGQIPIHLLPGEFEDYAADNWFVAFDTSDSLPNMIIGRIAGATPSLITTYVNKVLSYEAGTSAPSGSAAATVTLVADMDQIGGENFAGRTLALQSSLTTSNNSLIVPTILRSSPLTDAQMHSDIIAAFNSGSIVISYMGHGAEDRWADATVFINADAQALTNTTYPIVVAMDCLNGYFYDADPSYLSLSDTLLFNPNGGAIAMWASTSLSSPDVQQVLQNNFYSTLASNPGIRLGNAVQLAKLGMAWSGGTNELINSWTLLGDPMLKVRIPATKVAKNSQPVVVTPPSNSGNPQSGGGGPILGCGTTEKPQGPPSAGGLMIIGLCLSLLYLVTHRFPRMRKGYLSKLRTSLGELLVKNGLSHISHVIDHQLQRIWIEDG